MHELPVTQSILKIVTNHAEDANAERITDIYVVIGQLSSYIDDAIQFYWDIISDGTIAQGATLHFKRIAAEMQCNNCGEKYALDGGHRCPSCGGIDAAVTAGQEFFVESIDVEEQ
jgi:hydrogenase nickel incorporation protein HypA/HybF